MALWAFHLRQLSKSRKWLTLSSSCSKFQSVNHCLGKCDTKLTKYYMLCYFTLKITTSGLGANHLWRNSVIATLCNLKFSSILFSYVPHSIPHNKNLKRRKYLKVDYRNNFLRISSVKIYFIVSWLWAELMFEIEKKVILGIEVIRIPRRKKRTRAIVKICLVNVQKRKYSKITFSVTSSVSWWRDGEYFRNLDSWKWVLSGLSILDISACYQDACDDSLNN